MNILSDRKPHGIEGNLLRFNYTGYKFGFQGQEKDDEVKGNGNSLDFGSRIYDPRIGRWLSTDPRGAELPGSSPYNFALNSPLVFVDPDGEYPKVVITNEVTGYTIFRVYGALGGDDDVVIVVPTYRMIVYDVNEDGVETVMGEYNVTRDGWLAVGSEAGGLLLENHATDPTAGGTISETVNMNFRKTNHYAMGDVVYTLPELWAKSYPADFKDMGGEFDRRTNADGTQGVAKGVQIHVGGYYRGSNGNCSVAGGYGCFGIVDPSQIFDTEAAAMSAGLQEAGEMLMNTAMPVIIGIDPSNKAVQGFGSDVESARDASGAMKDKMQVEIQDRGVDYSTRKTTP